MVSAPVAKTPREDAATPLRHRAEALSSPLPPLLVAADHVAATVAQGVHGRRRGGAGEAFWQFRRYMQGDSVARIDWRRSARGPHAYIRETEWEAAQTVWLWRDPNPGMDWRSDPALEDKRARADLLVLALACLLVRGGERVALLDPADPRPGHGPATLERLSRQLTTQAPGDGVPPVLPLPRHARVVLVGDFLTPPERLAPVLNAYANAGVRGHLLWLLDPAEETLPYEGRVDFRAPGAAPPGFLAPRAQALRAAYHARLTGHAAALARLSGALGWTLTRHRSDQPAQAALLDLWSRMAPPR